MYKLNSDYINSDHPIFNNLHDIGQNSDRDLNDCLTPI